MINYVHLLATKEYIAQGFSLGFSLYERHAFDGENYHQQSCDFENVVAQYSYVAMNNETVLVLLRHCIF